MVLSLDKYASSSMNSNLVHHMLSIIASNSGHLSE
jgi:hypothetical protein